MNKLRNITQIVQDILENNEDARNSDNLLYIAVLKRLGSEKGINLDNMSIFSFLVKMQALGLPSIETVGRCRRKVVEEFPELAGNDTSQSHRRIRENKFREYARG